MSRKREGLIMDEEEQNKAKRARKSDNFPHELIENILTRLPARILTQYSSVSKLWFNSIFNDTQFAAHHFARQQNKRLVLNLINVFDQPIDWQMGYFFDLQNDDESLDFKRLMETSLDGIHELVGYCNGLACLRLFQFKRGQNAISIINPTRGEAFVFVYIPPPGGQEWEYLCQGFGFDSSSQVYKAVLIFTSTANEEIICMVFTLGTNSWRQLVTRTSDFSPPPGCAPFPRQVVIRASKVTRRSGAVCGGDLYWRITSNNAGQKIEMLLSFDIHSEKIHFVRLPAECSLTSTTTLRTDEHDCSLIDHQLLEFKGYLCVARIEKIMISHDRHCHREHRCIGLGRFCCCCFKVCLYKLKEKMEQVWIKEETFEVRIKDKDLLPAPFCCYFDTTTSNTTPPARILGFSNQLFLYWFDGVCLILYNLQTKHLKVVRCSCDKQNRHIFQLKLQRITPGRHIGVDDNIFCPHMDYQLHAQVENILSLRTFIPEGETRKFDGYDDFLQYLQSGKKPAGWLVTGRVAQKFHVFSS